MLAVLASMLGMLVYIWVRFELRFGIGALAAAVHDVLVTLGLFAFAGFEFNLTTVAAFLTLVGYSVNDTVVVFDRVRENMRRSRRTPLLEVMNQSLNQTLSRTILTGGTTLTACLALMILGGEVLRGFAFILFVGVIVGTYSSIYIASPFALLWEQVLRPRGAGAQRAEEKATAPAERLTAEELLPASRGLGRPAVYNPSGRWKTREPAAARPSTARGRVRFEDMVERLEAQRPAVRRGASLRRGLRLLGGACTRTSSAAPASRSSSIR